jgi:C1A family cysteine protease
MLHWTGDTGAYLRTAMGALVLFGVPPEEYWPYDVEAFEQEPPAFCYAFAQNFKAINYYRLDHPGITRSALLRRIKVNLLAGLPSMFGFTVFSSMSQAKDDGMIPFPTTLEKRRGGHAVVAIGYDDEVEIENKNKGGKKTEGALLIRNSWGSNWGENGYGWLPYEFIKRGLAIDWWSLIKQDWIETDVFKV